MDNFTAQTPDNSFSNSPVPFSYSTNNNLKKRKLLMGGIFIAFVGLLAVAAFAATRLNLENRSKAGFVNYPFFEMVTGPANETSKTYDVYLDGSGVPATTAIHTISLTLGMGKEAVILKTVSDASGEEAESAVLGDSTTNQIADTTTITVPMSGSGGSTISCKYYRDTQLQSQSGCPQGFVCQPLTASGANTGASVQNGYCVKISVVTSTPTPAKPTCSPRPSCLDQKPPCSVQSLLPFCPPTPTPSVKPTSVVTCTPRPSCLDAKPPCKIETFANPNWCETSPTPVKTTACDLKDLTSCSDGLICASPTFLPNSSMGINPTAGNCIASVGNQIDCGKDRACPSGMVCFQPAQAPCPSGMACAQVMPVAKCVNPAAIKTTNIPTGTVTPPLTSNFSVIYKDGAGTAISAYTGGSSIGIFNWDQVTANPNGLGLVLGAKVIDNASSQKFLHTRFKVATLTVPNSATPQVAAQSIRGTIAGVKTDVELYQPNLKPTVTPSNTPTPQVTNIPTPTLSERTCGQTCGSSVGLCAPGFTCRFINGDTCKTDSTNSTSLCVPNTMPANWKTFMCTGGGKYYVTTNNQTRMGTPTVQEVQNMCRQVVTPTPTSMISCTPGNPNSCPSGWSCLAPAACPPANPNCGAVPPHCVQNGAVTPTVTPTVAPTTVTCTPRPSCLDAKPPCKIETFANPNWCTPTPTPGSKTTYCTSNANCPAGTICYQPPMPPCPSGMACTQIMPRAYCTPGSVTPTAIGGQKDEHGCLIAAGYSWCDSKQKCLRTWEETCDTVIRVTVTPTPTVYKPTPTPTPNRPWYCGFLPYLCARPQY